MPKTTDKNAAVRSRLEKIGWTLTHEDDGTTPNADQAKVGREVFHPANYGARKLSPSGSPVEFSSDSMEKLLVQIRSWESLARPGDEG